MAAYGGVYVPRFCNGQFIYDKPPYIVKVSDKSAAIKEGRHFENFSDLHKQEILAFFLAERISYQDLKTSHEHRATINVRVLKHLKIEVPRFLHRRNRLV